MRLSNSYISIAGAGSKAVHCAAVLTVLAFLLQWGAHNRIAEVEFVSHPEPMCRRLAIALRLWGTHHVIHNKSVDWSAMLTYAHIVSCI
jgi:hypothetical protein